MFVGIFLFIKFMHMNQAQLQAKIAGKFGLPKTKADEILNFIIEEIASEVQAGGSVALRNLGTFKSVKRNARAGRNPATGTSLTIPARRTTDFNPTDRLRIMPLLSGDQEQQ